jgi:hypothetical protein
VPTFLKRTGHEVHEGHEDHEEEFFFTPLMFFMFPKKEDQR